MYVGLLVPREARQREPDGRVVAEQGLIRALAGGDLVVLDLRHLGHGEPEGLVLGGLQRVALTRRVLTGPGLRRDLLVLGLLGQGHRQADWLVSV